MTKYEYACAACKTSFEQNKRIPENDVKKTKCPNCGRRRLSRIWGPTNVIFKGQGFTKKLLS